MKKSLLSLLVSLTLMLALVQTSKAQYILKEADTQYELFNYVKAIDLYKQAYQKRQTLHAAERLTSCYELTRNYKQWESWAAIAAGIKGSSAENVLHYAKALQNNAKYAEAKVQYQQYLQLDSKMTDMQKKRWLQSCDSAMYWIKYPKTTAVLNQQELNTAQADWGLTKLDQTLIFASDRVAYNTVYDQEKRPFLKFDGAKRPDRTIYGWTRRHYIKLYAKTGETGAVAEFAVPYGTDYHVGPASFTANGKEMYFTLTRIAKDLKFVKGNLATVNVEIYSSEKGGDGKWMVPKPFFLNRINEYSVADPFISADGKTLYFSSNMPGGKGGSDLYTCTKIADGSWGKPVNLTEFNTEGNERSPFFDGNQTFYFSSDGLIGMGGLDIYRSISSAAGKSEKILNMGYPINSPQDDFAYVRISPLEGYFSSNRIGGMGSDDIYSFRINEALIFTLSGVAYNRQTKAPLANVTINLAKTDGGSLMAQTTTDGQYNFNLEKESDYNLNAKKMGFMSDNARVNTKGLMVSRALKQDFFLEPIVINKAIRIEHIFYDFDKWAIRPEAAKELDHLVKIMQDNPTIEIELGSHTDSRGKDQYNQWLSQQRSNSAVQYIIDKGIEKHRITAKGYGESQLLNNCANGVTCTEEAHQLNRRTEFKIVKE